MIRVNGRIPAFRRLRRPPTTSLERDGAQAMKPDTSRWTDASPYEFVRVAGANSVAWEFLRRNPSYQMDVECLDAGEAMAPETLQRWGLHFRSPA